MRVGATAVVRLAGFLLAYIAAAEIGHLLSFHNDLDSEFATFWPPSGVYLAVMLLSPSRRWPLVASTALLGNLTSDVLLHGKPVVVSAGFWTANTLEAVTGAVVLRWAVGTPFTINRLRNVVWFAVATAALGSMAGATVGALVVVSAFGGSYWSVWAVWWVSGALGVLLVAPAIVNFYTCRPWREPDRGRRLVEAMGIMVVTTVVAECVFGRQTSPLAFAVVPVLVWASIRLKVCGAVLATTVLAVVTVWNTSHGYGPFAVSRPGPEQVVLSQAFLGVSITLSLVLAALTMEWQSAAVAAENARRELVKVNAQLRLHAVTDGLTGLNNRRALNDQLAEEYNRAVRYGSPLSVILMDVDFFKLFNDTFGHPAGDEVLKTVASTLQITVRTTDFVARYGGEEFAVILPDTDHGGAMVLAERLRRAVAEAAWDKRPVTVSVGVSTLTTATADTATLIREADEALYQSKQAGRNRVESSSSSMSMTSLVRA